jgi:hypothetical protein
MTNIIDNIFVKLFFSLVFIKKYVEIWEEVS